MCTSRGMWCALLSLLLPCLWSPVGPAFAETGPGLGVPLDQDTIRRLDFTVLPDGTGLPDGGGSADRGEGLFQQHCAACHGGDGSGGPNDRLVGGIGSLATDTPVKTVGSYWPYATTLFDYIRRAMPYQAPGSLRADELYAVTAYVLFLNGVITDRNRVLDARTLPTIEMPNRDGFRWAVPSD